MGTQASALAGIVARITHGALRRHAQTSPRETLFFALRSGLSAIGKRQPPIPIHCASGPEVEAIRQCHEPLIITSPHYPYPALTSYFSETMPDKKFLILAYHPDLVKKSIAKNCPHALDRITIIQVDRFCFIRVQKLKRPQTLILCQPDYASRPDISCDTVSAGIFGYAWQTGTRLFTSSFQLSAEGAISLDLAELSACATSEAAVDAFIAHQAPQRLFQRETAAISARRSHHA